MKYLKKYEGIKSDLDEYKKGMAKSKPGINVYRNGGITEVYQDGKLIGQTADFGNKNPDNMSYRTFYLVYKDGDEDLIEEIDIYSLNGYDYAVAKSIADDGYTPDYDRIVSADDYHW